MSYTKKHPENISKRSMQRHILGRMMRHPHKEAPYTVVCLPGRKCWEVDYLSKYDYRTYEGVGPGVSKIIALEQDSEVFELIVEHTKDNDLVEVLNLTTTEFLHTTTEQVDLIYFDYYSNLSLQVIQDLDIMLEQKVLCEGGKYMVTFLAARENTACAIKHQRLFKTFCEAYEQALDWSEADEDFRRCIAFNSVIGQYRSKPLQNRVFARNATYVNTTAPSWHKYRNSSNITMLTAHFTLTKYATFQSRVTIKKALHLWFLKEPHSITDWKKAVVSADPQSNYAYWIDVVDAFYKKNHYTPTFRDLGKSSMRILPQIVKDLGLCPRQYRTPQDIEGEIDRIHDRDGIVTPLAIHKAKLPFKRALKVYTVLNMASYCDEKGYPHRLDIRRIKNDVSQRNVISEYLQWLTEGKLKSSFPKIHTIRRIFGKNYTGLQCVQRVKELEDEFERIGLSKDGELPTALTDAQLKKMYLKDGYSIVVLAHSQMVLVSEMQVRLKSLGIKIAPRAHRLRENLTARKVVKDFRALGSVIKVAVKYNTTTRFVAELLKSKGIYPEAVRQNAELDIEGIVDAYRAGATVAELSRDNNIGSWLIYAALKDANIQLKASNGSRFRNLPVDDICDDYKQGTPISHIAKKYGVASATIRRRLEIGGVLPVIQG